MVFLGPPGAAKTTFARVVGEGHFGLGRIERPDVLEVTGEDIVVGYVSRTAARMKEVCEETSGGVPFIDEAYHLVPTTEGHPFGKDAINTLPKYALANVLEPFRACRRSSPGRFQTCVARAHSRVCVLPWGHG